MTHRATAIREALKKSPHAPSEDIATAFVKSASRQVRDEWLTSLLTEEIEGMRRFVTRDQERAVFDEFAAGHIDTKAVVQFTPISFSTDGRELREKLIALGDGRKVTWGQATAQEHRQRAAMLEKLRSGLTETIERHTTAAALIEAAGVKCLDDLGTSAGMAAAS